jgi:hypothetical protein
MAFLKMLSQLDHAHIWMQNVAALTGDSCWAVTHGIRTSMVLACKDERNSVATSASSVSAIGAVAGARAAMGAEPGYTGGGIQAAVDAQKSREGAGATYRDNSGPLCASMLMGALMSHVVQWRPTAPRLPALCLVLQSQVEPS